MLCGAYAQVLIAAIEQVAKDKRDERAKAGTRTGERARCVILDLATSLALSSVAVSRASGMSIVCIGGLDSLRSCDY